MWKQKLCLCANLSCEMSIEEQIRMIHKAGFEAFFTDWKSGDPTEKYAALAKELGMTYQSIHAPFGKSADMWHGNEEEGTAATDELIECVHACAKSGVEIMIAHTYIGFGDDRKPTSAGLERYGKVVEEAKKQSVKVAFENTEGEEYLAALMEHFKDNDSVGFCWDTGHEMCYNYSKDLLALYGDRLIATHLNDNLGISDFGGRIFWTDDLHLLPFDGIADWDDITKRLDRCGFDGIMTFELNIRSKPDRHENDIYAKMTTEEYIAECYKRACKVAAKRQIKQK
ncbi:MAG: sugar phosphate isomerase/epimerase [Clostridia bacterium]|nr:sugar phosphate isomerase/epimerase [Clostridia bacterium]